MHGSEGGTPQSGGMVPFVFDGVTLMCAWLKSCEILCVESKKKLREFIGPLAAVVFKGTTADGESSKEVYLKVIGQTWTISVALYHWPNGSAVPYTLHFPSDALGSATQSGGEGAYVTWDDRVRQEIKRFRVRRTLKDEARLWRRLRLLTSDCKAVSLLIADDVEVGVTEAPPTGAARVEGELRAAQAAQQVEAAAQSMRIRVIREGESLEYDGKTYEFRGDKRWEIVAKLMGGGGQYVECGRGLKGYFTSNGEAKAFFDAAIEAVAPGRNGTGHYRLKI